MITLQDEVKTLIIGVCPQTYYFYPASWAVLPCVAWRESGNREIAQTDGREHLAEVIYTVDIWGRSASENAQLAAVIDSRMASRRLRRTYSADMFEKNTRLHHRILRYRAVADAAGNIYQ